MVELMAVVFITGITATLAVAAFRKHLLASRGTEAVDVILACRSSEEAYRAENHVYLNVSTADTWYPIATPDKGKHNWVPTSHVDLARWQTLAPSVNHLVMFTYLVYAGTPGTSIPVPAITSPPNFNNPQPLDWYLLQAKGDTDGNGIFTTYASTSITGEVYVENEGE